ncbi:MAG: FG-GAP-like repeat-containing protein, partial [Verrucomicrobiota bacterium]
SVIYLQRVDQAGVLDPAGPIPFRRPGSSQNRFPDITRLPDGGWVIHWNDRFGNLDEIVRQRFYPDGTPYVFEELVDGSVTVQATVSDGLFNQGSNSANTTLDRSFFVSGTDPVHADPSVEPGADITITFTDLIDTSTVDSTSFEVWGQQTGYQTGTYSFSSAVFTPDQPFKPGEQVVVMLHSNLLSTSGDNLRPHRFQFTAETAGTGTFEGYFRSQRFNIDDGFDTRVALGDVNGDGHLDAVVSGQMPTNALTVFLNDGTGHLVSNLVIDIIGFKNVALADYDHDGDLDAYVLGARVLIFPNDGTGLFNTNTLVEGPAIFPADGDIIPAELNGDHHLDLAVVDGFGITVFFNDGIGGFTAGPSFSPGSIRRLAGVAGDFDGDGDIDLFTGGGNNGNGVAPDDVLLNDGSGGFTVGQSMPGQYTRALAVGDVDGDGDLDIVKSTDFGPVGDIWVLMNDGTGTFSTNQILTNGASSREPALGDVDGDGDLDLLTARKIFLNDGNGQFSTVIDSLPENSEASDFVVGDLNGDGKLDLVGVYSPHILVWLNGFDTKLHWPLEEGAGTNTLEKISGTSNRTVLVNSPPWIGNGPAVEGSNAVQLSSGPDYIDAGTLLSDGTYISGTNNVFVTLDQAWTITAWLRLNPVQNAGGDRVIASSAFATAGDSWWLFFVGIEEHLGFDFNSARIDSGLSVPLDQNVFVAISADLNGGLPGGFMHRFSIWDGTTWQTQYGTRFSKLQLHDIQLGRFTPGSPRSFEGVIDDVRIFGQALTQSQLDFLSEANTDGDGQIDYFDIDDDDDDIIDVDELQTYLTDPKVADTDGDGLSDTLEIFRFGSDPLDPNSNLKISTFSVVNGLISLSWQSYTNGQYGLWYRTSLLSGSWNPVGGHLDIPATPPLNVISNLVPESAERVYYSLGLPFDD